MSRVETGKPFRTRQVFANQTKDGILYPSVFDRCRENIVLRTDAANERAIPRVVVVCRLESPLDAGAISLTAESVGCSSPGSDGIAYRPMSPSLIPENKDLGLNAITTLLEGKDPWPSIKSAMNRSVEDLPYDKLNKPSS